MLIAWPVFGSVCAAMICVMINLIMPAGGWWLLFVAVGITSLWVDVSFTVKKRKNLSKNILWQMITVTLIVFLWDFLTGLGDWPLNSISPILCSYTPLVMTTVVKARRLDIQGYVLYLVIDCILGIVYFILIPTGAVCIVIPSVIGFGASIVLLVLPLFFEGKAFRTEVQRRSHL